MQLSSGELHNLSELILSCVNSIILYTIYCVWCEQVILYRKQGDIMAKLTGKQKTFYDEYLIDLNAT